MVRLKVKEVAEERGWNAARLGRKADLSNTAMYGIWNGTTADPGLLTLEKLARVLGVRICDLFEESGEDAHGHATMDDIEALQEAA